MKRITYFIQKKYYYFIAEYKNLLLLLILAAQGCCIGENLEFDISEIPDAILNQEYSVIITAQVSNTSNDDNYKYTLDLEGSLPEGLVLINQPENRRILIQGTPLELGSFDFILKAEVDDNYDPFEDEDFSETWVLEATYIIVEDEACSNNYEHEQLFTLNVVVM